MPFMLPTSPTPFSGADRRSGSRRRILRRRRIRRRSAAVLAGLKSPWGEVYVMAACCHAELSGLGGLPGSGVSAAEGQVEAQMAMELLRKAIAKGMRDAAWLRTERGLDPIRGRDDFRLIMMDIEFPAQPFARAD